jgi:hypothetical protein
MLEARRLPKLSQGAAWAPDQLPQLGKTNSKLVELRCHALKDKKMIFSRSPSDSYGLPMISALNEDFSDNLDFNRAPENKRHVSASAQRRYTDQHLYRRPKNGKPGSVADLQARLESLRQENKVLQHEEHEREKTLDKRTKALMVLMM